MAASLRISLADAKQVISILELQGYVKPAGSGEWMTTLAGESVSGSREPRFTPERVLQALDELRRRIAEMSRNSRAPYKITKAVAFGDFMNDRARVQAADVGIQLRRKGRSTLDAVSQEESKQRAKVLKQLQGKGGTLLVRPFEEWMDERAHQDLL